MATPEDVCPTCDECLPIDGRFLKCSDCEYAYHLGTCSGCSEATFKGKAESARRSWRCLNCRASKTKGTGKAAPDADLSSSLAEIVRRLDALSCLPTQVDEVKASIEMMSNKYDDILNKQAVHDKEISDLKKRVSVLERGRATDDVESIKSSLNDLEWRSRKQNIEVYGIPKSDSEDLISKLNEVATAVNLPPLSGNDVDAVHRLPSKPGSEAGIIVRFYRQSLRDAWLEKRKVLRESKSAVSITENMTKQNRDLLRCTRAWAEENGYRFSWHANNKILLRRAAGDPKIVVRNKRHLEELNAA